LTPGPGPALYGSIIDALATGYGLIEGHVAHRND